MSCAFHQWFLLSVGNCERIGEERSDAATLAGFDREREGERVLASKAEYLGGRETWRWWLGSGRNIFLFFWCCIISRCPAAVTFLVNLEAHLAHKQYHKRNI
jgi:hypothetical protein